MADYYTQFSFAIRLETDEQRAWCTDTVVFLESLVDATVDVDDPRVQSDRRCSVFDDDPCYVGFEAELDDDGLWIHSDESGSVDQAANFVQLFLRTFDRSGIVYIEWANTCSRPLLDAFGGGAVVVTARTQKWVDSANWAGKEVARIEKRRANSNVGV